MAELDLKYSYAPILPEEFRCRVPLEGTVQLLVHNGILKGEYRGESGEEVSAKESGYNLILKSGAHSKSTTQIISFRDCHDTSDIEFSNEIHFEEGSEAEILLCYHTLSMDEFDTTEEINIKVDKGAKGEIVVMQNEHNDSRHTTKFNIEVDEEAFLRINVVTLHGAQLDNSFDVKLKGERANCELNGIYLMDGEQIVNSNIRMNHLVPNCLSSQLFKGILDDKAFARFTGRIVVAQDAQKTEAFQSNHNLLISKEARAYTEPQLEIYADDVSCSHGATSGSLDEEGLFYMRQRGIAEREAKLLLQLAFVYDVLGEISNQELRDRLVDLVELRLRGEFAHCENCSMNCC